MMRIPTLFLTLLFFLRLGPGHVTSQEMRPSIAGVEAKAFLLVDGQTGKIIAQRNPHQKHPPASTTKLMTALLVYEKKGLNGRVKVVPSDTRVVPSHVPLRPGEVVPVVDLMHATIITSGNDAAKALARYTAGSDEAFIDMMNARARQLGCRNTVFKNPNGLPAPGMVSTVSDLMLIFRKVLSYPDLSRMFASTDYVLKTRAGRRVLKNHNRLLGRYPGMGPAKTGWTVSSRHTYAASVTRNGRTVYLTLLNSPNKWRDAVALFDYAFANLPSSRPSSPPSGTKKSTSTSSSIPSRQVVASSAARAPVTEPTVASPVDTAAATPMVETIQEDVEVQIISVPKSH
ncbi:D-alanyl-D-alanine carboxypeptidase family protein [Oscillatoria laete-virens NRMC-F 0139]|nr:D-alanyl-D-alanine carboxypeptidase family protein [Oscillatoria laete-virens]MDL5054502.1 D-alanyl-D-alanine carboxypeptidase family protein [Oscillatoria laete-virens NRMC-F 0139]